MDILNVLKQLRDDIKSWVTANLKALNTKIDEKTIPIDIELNSESTNLVQNKAIAKEIDSINERIGDTPVSTQISQAINAQEYFSGDYNDLINVPNISKDSSGNTVITDESGNIIFKADADGIHTTSLTLNGESVTEIVDERVASLVDSAPDTLNTLNELAAALGDDPNFATTIAAEIGKKVDKVSGKWLSENDFTNEYKNILDNLGSMAFEESDPTVPDWAKSAEKPTYTKSEVGLGNVDNTSDINKPVSTATQAALNELKEELSESIVSESESWTLVDNSGNIVAKIDQNGLDVTSINTNAITINGLSLEDVIAAKVQEYIDTAILGGKW